MDLNSVANLAEIVSAVAVVVTLVYLATQIRQAKEQLQLQGRQARADAARDVLLAISEHNFRALPAADRATQDQLLMMWLSTTWGAGFWDQVKAIYDHDFQVYVDGLRSRLADAPKPAQELLKER